MHSYSWNVAIRPTALFWAHPNQSDDSKIWNVNTLDVFITGIYKISFFATWALTHGWLRIVVGVEQLQARDGVFRTTAFSLQDYLYDCQYINATHLVWNAVVIMKPDSGFGYLTKLIRLKTSNVI